MRHNVAIGSGNTERCIRWNRKCNSNDCVNVTEIFNPRLTNLLRYGVIKI